MYLFKVLISLPLHIYPEVELLDRIVVLFLVFWVIPILFCIVAILIYSPTNNVQGFPFGHTLANTTFWLFDNSPLNRCAVITHCGADLPSSDDLWCQAAFMYLLQLYVFFAKNFCSTSLFIFYFLNQAIYFLGWWVPYIFWLLALIRYMAAFSFFWLFPLLYRNICIDVVSFAYFGWFIL